MPYLKTYDLFISHAWKYGDEYTRLERLLKNSKNFYYRNYSAPSDKPLHNLDSTDVVTKNQIENAIKRKISPVNAVLVISGMYANNRYWMEKEIHTAITMDKPIIAIKPYGNTVMPNFIRACADEIVNWNTDSIISAIRRHAI
jgi:hypothetical protein